MKKIVFLFLFALLILRANCQTGATQRTALVNLQKAGVVESSRAGQFGLTDANGNQRYAQFVEVDLTPIAYTPPTTGNTANFSEFVTTTGGDIYYIDWQGRSIKLWDASAGGGGTNDYDWLEIGNNQVPNSILDSIYTSKYAAVNMRRVWPNAQFLIGDSTSTNGANGIAAGDRNARWGFVRMLDGSWSSIGQEGTNNTVRLGPGTQAMKIQVAAGPSPSEATAPFRDVASFRTDSLIRFNDYPNTRNDTATAVNFFYSDAQGYLKSGPVSEISGGGGGSNAPDSTFAKLDNSYWGKNTTLPVFRTGDVAIGRNADLAAVSIYGEASILKPILSLSADTTKNIHVWLKAEQTRSNPYAYTPFGLVSSYDGVQPGGYDDYVWSFGPNCRGNSGSSWDATKPMASINWETSWVEGGYPTYEWHEHWKAPDSAAIRLKSYTIRYSNGRFPGLAKNIDLYHTADQFSVKTGNSSKGNPQYFGVSCSSYSSENSTLFLRWKPGYFFNIVGNSGDLALYTTGGSTGTNRLNFGLNDAVVFSGANLYTKSTQTLDMYNFNVSNQLNFTGKRIGISSGSRFLSTGNDEFGVYLGLVAGPNTQINGENVAVGIASMRDATNGATRNAAIGPYTLRYMGAPTGNAILGAYAVANSNSAVHKNIIIGDSCAFSLGGFSQKLLIENSPSSTYLISGDFLTNKVGVNVPSAAPRTTLDIRGTDAISVPSGTTAQRPTTPTAGDIRHNSTKNEYEAAISGTFFNISRNVKGTATLDFPSTTGPLPETLTITVTGAAVGDVCQVSPLSAWPGTSFLLNSWVSATNQVTVQVTNLSGIAVDLPSQGFNIIVTKF